MFFCVHEGSILYNLWQVLQKEKLDWVSGLEEDKDGVTYYHNITSETSRIIAVLSLSILYQIHN